MTTLLSLTSSTIIAWSALLVYATAHPTDPYHTFPYYHPDLDASAESLGDYCSDDPPYIPVFPNGYETEQVLNQKSPSSTENSFVPNYDAIADTEMVPESSMTRQSQSISGNDSWVAQQGHIDIDDQHLSETDRINLARNEFRIAAEQMGCDLAPIPLRRRFKNFATPILIADLLSNDRKRRWKATASIMMHRVCSRKLVDIEDMTTEPIYEDLTKEDLLGRMWEIMNVAPAEDARQWWYDRIVYHMQKSDFADLFSDDRRTQEAAVARISGLSRKGHIWVKIYKGKSRT